MVASQNLTLMELAAGSRFSYTFTASVITHHFTQVVFVYCLQVRHLENVAGSKDTAVSQMQRVHEEQLENLAGVAEDRGTFWQQQKAELEEHYGQLLGEIQARNKVSTTGGDGRVWCFPGLPEQFDQRSCAFQFKWY